MKKNILFLLSILIILSNSISNTAARFTRPLLAKATTQKTSHFLSKIINKQNIKTTTDAMRNFWVWDAKQLFKKPTSFKDAVIKGIEPNYLIHKDKEGGKLLKDIYHNPLSVETYNPITKYSKKKNPTGWKEFPTDKSIIKRPNPTILPKESSFIPKQQKPKELSFNERLLKNLPKSTFSKVPLPEMTTLHLPKRIPII